MGFQPSSWVGLRRGEAAKMSCLNYEISYPKRVLAIEVLTLFGILLMVFDILIFVHIFQL